MSQNFPKRRHEQNKNKGSVSTKICSFKSRQEKLILVSIVIQHKFSLYSDNLIASQILLQNLQSWRALVFLSHLYEGLNGFQNKKIAVVLEINPISKCPENHFIFVFVHGHLQN